MTFQKFCEAKLRLFICFVLNVNSFINMYILDKNSRKILLKVAFAAAKSDKTKLIFALSSFSLTATESVIADKKTFMKINKCNSNNLYYHGLCFAS